MAWDLQASAGAVGKSILWRGDWSAAISYNPNDAVAYQGSSYICLEAAIGVPPPDAASSFVPALANTSSQGAIAALPASNQTSYYARGDNTWQLFQAAEPRLPRNHLAGLTIANNATDAANDIDINGGECRDSTNSVDIKIPASITKRLDAAWVVGTGQGGLDTGTVANATYHVFVIKRMDTGVCDALFSASPTAPTLPANYTVFRRVGSIVRSASINQSFTQIGDNFYLTTAVVTFNTTSAFAKALVTFTVPNAITVFPMMFVVMTQNAVGASTVILYPGVGATTVGVHCSVRVANQSGSLIVTHLPSNLSSQLYVELTVVGTLIGATVFTHGWVDTRDRI